MSEKDDGGPAFPPPHECGYFSEDGMSLRDYFASKAMSGMWASGRRNTDDIENFGRLALRAYLMADAMLKARSE